MDIVTDLTSQAVAFIGIIQDICNKLPDAIDGGDSFRRFHKVSKKIKNLVEDWKEDEEKCRYELGQMSEVVWISKKMEFKMDSLECFIDCSDKLMDWYDKFDEEVEEHFDKRFGKYPGGSQSTPYQWRERIRYVLYKYPHERETVLKIIHYIPIQMVLVAGGGVLDEYAMSLFQVWEPGYKLNVTTEYDREKCAKWWQSIYKGKKREERLFELLIDDPRLVDELNEENIPVPFETILADELGEIEKSRNLRLADDYKYPDTEVSKCLAGKKPGHRQSHTADPLSRAKSMRLYGLAFSGGGIRSATFNLGILQRLAETGLLKRFDYLSTVSGGGYIGCWLESWIMRSRSIEKVNDRLDHEKSADPLAEEVRPIRWLRMFSNYLAPNKSIMSADSWTMGVTWLRNTIVNQIVLILLLCSALWLVRFSFELWQYIVTIKDSPGTAALLSLGKIAAPLSLSEIGKALPVWRIFLYSVLVFFPAALLAGKGMSVYADKPGQKSSFNREKNALLAYLLIVWGLLSAFTLSSWFFMNWTSANGLLPIVNLLWPAAIVGFVALLGVAWMGDYARINTELPWKKKLSNQFFIIFSSLAAAVAGLFLLALSWQFFNVLHSYPSQRYCKQLGYVLGLPVIMEIISIIVVIRMALLGNIFPDERREWWGRVGAIAHRFMFLWIITISVILCLPHLKGLFNGYYAAKMLTLLGGWSGIIGYALKQAFSPKTSGNKETKGTQSATEVFVQVAPYVFLLGVVVIGAYFVNKFTVLIGAYFGVVHHAKNITNQIETQNLQINTLICIGMCLAVGLVTVFISWRVGVNDFSLHHFYRNRLVRAYLGATKSRKSREKTVNNFTGFDSADDLNLASLVADDYQGPYPVINATLNVTEVVEGELDRQDRKAESFVFTPKYCGFDFSRTRSASRSVKKSYDYGYRPTGEYSGPDGPSLGTAMAVSGAAVNPNWGYHSSPATAFMLTVFNLRLGRWMGNPRKSEWRFSDPKFGLAYLIYDLLGISDASSSFVCLSDGGHFDNMGLYELVRRRCRHIVVCDAEEDADSTCEGLANAIRRCRIDFGVQITVDVAPILQKKQNKLVHKHWVSGHIWYPDDPADEPSGTLIYAKTALTSDLTSVDVREYFLTNPAFPQQSTADQFFDESQFESYRALGYASLR